MKSGLEIAQDADLRPIADIAADAGIEPDELEQYGRYRAKIDLSILDRLADRPDGKLIITTAITPTKAGEGKTTTSVSLTQGLGKIGRRVMLCLREPSMGPVWGIKGGGYMASNNFALSDLDDATRNHLLDMKPALGTMPSWSQRGIDAATLKMLAVYVYQLTPGKH